MRDPAFSGALRDEEIGSLGYASFILRCWRGEGEQVRIRLVDVNSGVSHALADLSRLPALLRALLGEPQENRSEW